MSNYKLGQSLMWIVIGLCAIAAVLIAASTEAGAIGLAMASFGLGPMVRVSDRLLIPAEDARKVYSAKVRMSDLAESCRRSGQMTRPQIRAYKRFSKVVSNIVAKYAPAMLLGLVGALAYALPDLGATGAAMAMGGVAAIMPEPNCKCPTCGKPFNSVTPSLPQECPECVDTWIEKMTSRHKARIKSLQGESSKAESDSGPKWLEHIGCRIDGEDAESLKKDREVCIKYHTRTLSGGQLTGAQADVWQKAIERVKSVLSKYSDLSTGKIN